VSVDLGVTENPAGQANLETQLSLPHTSLSMGTNRSCHPAVPGQLLLQSVCMQGADHLVQGTDGGSGQQRASDTRNSLPRAQPEPGPDHLRAGKTSYGSVTPKLSTWETEETTGSAGLGQ
jgi:hypothetical protein